MTETLQEIVWVNGQNLFSILEPIFAKEFYNVFFNFLNFLKNCMKVKSTYGRNGEKNWKKCQKNFWKNFHIKRYIKSKNVSWDFMF